MRSPVSVRTARAEDAEAVLSLFAALDAIHAAIQPGFFRATAAPRGPSARHAMARALAERGTTLLVAEREGDGAPRVLGVARLRVHDTPPSPELSPRRRAHLEQLFVAERARRGGVGRALMTAAERAARAAGAEQLVLTVWQGNAAAEPFYRALGYLPASQVLCRELA